jgi:hypothetical protein
VQQQDGGCRGISGFAVEDVEAFDFDGLVFSHNISFRWFLFSHSRHLQGPFFWGIDRSPTPFNGEFSLQKGQTDKEKRLRSLPHVLRESVRLRRPRLNFSESIPIAPKATVRLRESLMPTVSSSEKFNGGD